MFTDWLVGQTSPPRPSSGISPWNIFLAIAAVVGVSAAVQQLLSFITGRRRQKALEQFAEDVADRIDTRSTEKQLSRLRQLRDGIQDQIENQLPHEARRAYLKNRLDTLASSIGEVFAEYQAIERELALDVSDSPLEASLREVVETTIVPAYRQRERYQRQLRLLLIVTLVLLISPISPGYLVFAPIGAYFTVTGEPDSYLPAALVNTILLGSLAVAAVSVAIFIMFRKMGARLPVSDAMLSRRKVLIPILIVVLLGGMSCLFLALTFRGAAHSAYQAWSDSQFSDDQASAQLFRERSLSKGMSAAATILIAGGIFIIGSMTRVQPWRGGLHRLLRVLRQ
jgi:hypothetical protein